MDVAVVLVAAGAGNRLGADQPKALVWLAGRPLVAHAAARVAETGMVGTLVITAPGGYGEQIRTAAADALQSAATPVTLQVVEGPFPSRQASVAAGLAHVDPQTPVVLVHDAARPLTPPAMMVRLIQAIRSGHDAVVPAVPVADTIRAVDPSDPSNAQGVVDRRQLRAVQTPQAFRGEVLHRAHAHGAGRADDEDAAATDDAALVEELSIPVHLIDGDRAAMKITDRHDLAVAASFLTEGA